MQDVIDSCSSSDTSAKCVICLQLDEYVEAGWGYSKYVHEKPTISDYGKDAAFVGYVRPDEMERQVPADAHALVPGCLALSLLCEGCSPLPGGSLQFLLQVSDSV